MFTVEWYLLISVSIKDLKEATREASHFARLNFSPFVKLVQCSYAEKNFLIIKIVDKYGIVILDKLSSMAVQ